MTIRSAHEVQILAEAKFSKDMAETLQGHFDNYAIDEVVTIEVTDKGLWLKTPFGTRQFLGSTEVIRDTDHQVAQH